MKKEKIIKIIVVIALAIDLIIFGSLIYSNNKLKQEIAYLQNNYKELQNSVSVQGGDISNIKSKIDEMTELTDDLTEQKKIESDPYYEAIKNLDDTIFLTNLQSRNIR